ncbi:MAG TPA: hypothetical protein VMG12_35755 [Polyangiaceae bacterium]|nr:hypothetical protein [Polyangiaceae bacterium]
MLFFLSVRGERVLLFSIASALAACAGTPAPKAENHACFRALDCQAGLVCVEGRCTADLTPIVPEGAGAAAPPDTPRVDAGVDYE